MFGGSFTSNYGEEVDITGAWRATLNGISEAKIKNGLGNLADNETKYPPNATEFRALCLRKRSPPVHPSHRQFKPELRIQKGTKEESRALAMKCLQEVRDNMNRSKA